ncbi:hypothetical protein [Candidatus Rhabdochlamydia sp. T3358]|uniref:hypothetical protein n=1 Tax=Candidatus Rhabdochlamydia sp. T3358 TaxID=2099795 RepID=UPI0010B87D84|nr:hypothetical protein [Candidatus Rhabdochlamydia sp. T3358]VHO02118.1 hypothetical protein RHT_00426 [Candidatus Rhabdochlamydia sp. T3358]
MLNTLQKELLDLISQATGLLKESSCSSRISPEAYEFFHPPIPLSETIKPLAKPQEVKQKPILKQTSLDSWPSIRSKLQKIAPNIKLHDTILDDLKAQKAANSWNEQIEVVIITGSVSNEELLFLKDLARAIHDRLSVTKLISGTKLEKEKGWESFFKKNSLKLIILTQAAQQYTTLMCYKQQKNQLAAIPLIILEALETYIQPDQKTALWKSLCQILTPAASSL